MAATGVSRIGRSIVIGAVAVLVGTAVSIGVSSAVSATSAFGAQPTTPTSVAGTDTPNVDPDTYSCNQSGYIDFENFTDGFDLSANAVGGVQFTTTNGYTWLVGDFATGKYNGKYPNGQYTSQGTHWAWLGENEGAGRIDFVDGPTSYFSLLTSANTPVEVDAYDSSNNLLAVAGPVASNVGTGTMDQLAVSSSSKNIAYVIVHDDGNFFTVDSICTNAPGVTQSSTRYVALGDSYSSGEGAIDTEGNPSFIPTTDLSGVDECHRSLNAYPEILSTSPQLNSTNAGFVFAACSGARVANFVKNMAGDGGWNEGPQLDQIAPASTPSPSTGLVTLSIGGNDVGFVADLAACIHGLVRGSSGCATQITDRLSKGLTLLSGGGRVFYPVNNLDGWQFCPPGQFCNLIRPQVVDVPSLSQLYTDIHVRAPNAKIVVLGYPQLFPAIRHQAAWLEYSGMRSIRISSTV